MSQATGVKIVVSEQLKNEQPRLSEKGAAKAESRRLRLAAALRQNLRRRKTQKVARKTARSLDNLDGRLTGGNE